MLAKLPSSGTICKLLIALVFFVLSSIAHAETEKVIRLATTTSTDNSGLLEKLLPPFEQKYGYQVHTIAVGTGKALRMGREGDVDLVLVHAPQHEELFVASGYGVNRRSVMQNDFVIIGPTSDPAGIKKIRGVINVFKKLAQTEPPFVSRGDDSGTHKKELSIWKESGIEPKGDWYRNAGQGMGMVLSMSNQMDAYTLADRGTWLAMKEKLDLVLLNSGDTELLNPYSIIAVNPWLHKDINYIGGMALIAWMTSPEGQKIIDDFRVEGQRLFVGTARREVIKRDRNQ